MVHGFEETPDEGGDRGSLPGCPNPREAVGFVGDGYRDVFHGTPIRRRMSLPARALFEIVRQGAVIICKPPAVGLAAFGRVLGRLSSGTTMSETRDFRPSGYIICEKWANLRAHFREIA